MQIAARGERADRAAQARGARGGLDDDVVAAGGPGDRPRAEATRRSRGARRRRRGSRPRPRARPRARRRRGRCSARRRRCTSTDAPGRSASGRATQRQASARLSPAAATRSAGTPAGTGTSMWSANGTRTASATTPPQDPAAGPKPNAASSPPVVVEHLEVRPLRHCAQVPHDTAHGTTTVCPTATPRTSVADGHDLRDALVPDRERALERHRAADAADDAVDGADRHPDLQRPRHGTVDREVSPSQRPATNGRTIASPGSRTRGASASRHASRPLRTKASSRSRHCRPYESWSTDRTFPAGSVNHAIGGPPARAMPRESCSKPS